MVPQQWFRVALLLVATACALRYDPSQVAYNVNTNQSAVDPSSYWGEWKSHNFHPSPSNWRLPFYTVLLDRFANGDPTNDDANGTQFEHDLTQTQLRHGGDIKGLQDSLDYLQGMGIKVIPPNDGTSSYLTTSRCCISQAVRTSMFHGQQMDTALWT